VRGLPGHGRASLEALRPAQLRGLLRFFRSAPPSRRAERPELELTPPPAAARRERNVSPASYVAVSFLFSAVLFGIFLVSERGFLKVRRQRLELARLQAEVSTLAVENDRLDAEVKALIGEPRAVERIAREDLGFVKSDEVVIRLPKGWQKKNEKAPGPASPTTLTTPRPAPR